MSGKTLIMHKKLGSALVIGAAFFLAACDEAGGVRLPGMDGGDGATAAAAATPDNAMTLVERDVEAPEIFATQDAGLWDGRPSLGGVWVAHPDVTDPERVIIRNAANGESVIGALFRRERDNPGPLLQVSSDAASALGMLAGAPTQLSVTALRRAEGPAAASDDITAAPTAALDAPSQIAATSLDPVAGAAAAIDAAEAEASSAAAPAPASAAPASALARPFVQIGIFSIEDNATGTADQLRQNGLSANVIAQESRGRNFWRVTVGPAPSVSDRDAVLTRVRELGFSDAYAVTN